MSVALDGSFAVRSWRAADTWLPCQYAGVRLRLCAQRRKTLVRVHQRCTLALAGAVRERVALPALSAPTQSLTLQSALLRRRLSKRTETVDRRCATWRDASAFLAGQPRKLPAAQMFVDPSSARQVSSAGWSRPRASTAHP